MCGIVGMVSVQECAPLLLDALHRLAYRGYDSAGIATLPGRTDRFGARAEGKLDQFGRGIAAGAPLPTAPPGSVIPVGPRTAPPTENNAHPHATSRVAVVHNGIIENHDELRHDIWRQPVRFFGHRDRHGDRSHNRSISNLQRGMDPVAGGQCLRSAAYERCLCAGAHFCRPPRSDHLRATGARRWPWDLGAGEMFIGSGRSVTLAPLTLPDRLSQNR